MTNPQPQKNPKLDQFLKEFNELLNRYQYKIDPVLNIGPQGILPSLTVADKVPSRKESKPIKKSIKESVKEFIKSKKVRKEK